MNFYPFHIGDYLSHTAHLSDAEDLGYRRMLDLYYQTEKPFSDIQYVVRRVRSTDQIVDTLLTEFFRHDHSTGFWHHDRCDEEIAKYHAKADSARKANQARWASDRHLKSDTPQILTNNHKPITNNQEPNIKPKRTTALVRPDSVSESIWSDFVAMRKAKRSPLTQTALNGIAAEANKAGIPLESALEICCSRGWQGFKADWLFERTSGNGGLSRQQRVESANKQALDEWLNERSEPLIAMNKAAEEAGEDL